jgi:hypothetical protein
MFMNLILLSIMNNNNANKNQFTQPSMSYLLPNTQSTSILDTSNNLTKANDKTVLVLVDSGSAKYAKKEMILISPIYLPRH